jgi:hypothetical protein
MRDKITVYLGSGIAGVCKNWAYYSAEEPKDSLFQYWYWDENGVPVLWGAEATE